MPSASTAIAAPVATTAINPPRGAWVIYAEFNDQHGGFVARKFLIGKVFCFDTDEELRADTLSELHALLPAGLVNVGRDESDGREVVETWV